MSSPSPSTTPLSSLPGPENGPTGGRRAGRWRFWLLLLALAMVGALVLIGGQWLNQRQNSMIPGRPLSYPQTHLHTVVMSTRPGVVYLGTHYGLFTSTDGGKTWPQRQGDLNTSMITSIAVSPTNPSLLAILAIPTSGLGQQLGIYVSANNGQSWKFTTPTGLPSSAYPYAIQSGPGTGGHFYVFFSYAGWFETEDLGQHWHAITSGKLAGIQTPSLLNDPANPAHLLLGGDLGLFETHDDGQNWQKITSVSGSTLALAATVPDAHTSRVIFISSEQGLYRWQTGENGAPTLTHITSLPNPSPPTRLVVSPDGSALYALCGTDLWFSANQGKSWEHRWHFTRGDLVSLALNPTNARELLAGFFSPALVLISTNAGSSWQTLTH